MDTFEYRELFKDFPLLDSYPFRFHKTSEKTPVYNCIAWALRDSKRFWWPIGGYWPHDCPRQTTIDAFERAFASQGYCRCENGQLESNVEKIALFAKESKPTHAARQLPSGRWTSKLGQNIDIEHDVSDVQGPRYGMIVAYFRRDRKS
jgi:hypothetical protein